MAWFQPDGCCLAQPSCHNRAQHCLSHRRDADTHGQSISCCNCASTKASLTELCAAERNCKSKLLTQQVELPPKMSSIVPMHVLVQHQQPTAATCPATSRVTCRQTPAELASICQQEGVGCSVVVTVCMHGAWLAWLPHHLFQCLAAHNTQLVFGLYATGLQCCIAQGMP